MRRSPSFPLSSLVPLVAGATGLALVSGCSAGAASPAASGGAAPVAVATTTQLGSVLSDIATCAGSASATLMGAGDDPHTFSVSSSQVAEMARARLVVANGLGLEEGLTDTLANLGADGVRVLEVAPRLDPLSFEEIEEARAAEHAGHDHAATAEEHDDGHAHGPEDPHVHLDVARMARAASVIGDELAAVTGEDAYATCGASVHDDLMATDAEVRQILSAIPADKRVLVTDHEAYNYFADAYGFDIAGVVVTGGSTDAAASSRSIAELVEVIRADGVAAVVSNNTVDPSLVEAVARETGTDLPVVQLYEGSVGPEGSGAETYAGMMTTNARRLADALA